MAYSDEGHGVVIEEIGVWLAHQTEITVTGTRFLQQGHEVRAVANPLENLTTDSEYVANFLRTLSGPVVLVGHSYGGSVIINAAAGNSDVKALVYVDAAAGALADDDHRRWLASDVDLTPRRGDRRDHPGHCVGALTDVHGHTSPLGLPPRRESRTPAGG